MPYRIELHGAEQGALDRLVDLGALDVEADGESLAALMPDGVAPDVVGRAVGARRFSVSPAIGRDDESVWTLSPRDLRVGSHTVRLEDARVFGSGRHPTTALCLDLLADLVAHDCPATLLDVGTGSGVLAIAALLLGVPRVTAIDVDAEAVRVAVENARLNGVGDRLDVVHGSPEAVSGTWPLVVANVLAAPLVDMAPVLVRRVGHYGRLVLSGIPHSAEPDVGRAYRHTGMRHVRRDERGGWVAMLLQATW